MSKGEFFFRWAKQFNLRINAAQGPTFVTARGCSNIDFFIGRGVTPGAPCVLSGVWSGASDHEPVLSIVSGRLQRSVCQEHFSSTLLLKMQHQDSARDYYNSHIPKLIAQPDEVSTASQLETLHETFCTVMLQPWRQVRPKRPEKLRTVWDRRLERLAQAKTQSILRCKNIR